MLRNALVIAMAVIFAFTAAGSCLALEKGNKRKGKYTYRKVYKSCYERGAVESEVPHLSPADKTQAEWKDVFESQNFEEFGCEEEWTAMGEKDVSDIYSYFYEHASDSPTPAKCK